MDYYAEIHRVAAEADVRRLEAPPLAERQLPASTYELIRNAAERHPDKTAIHHVDDGDHLDTTRVITYQQLLQGIHRVANLLHNHGLGATDVVGVLLPNCPQAQFALWGSEAAGILCPVNWMLDPSIIVSLLRAAGARALIVYGPDEEFEIWRKAQEVRRLLPGLRLVLKMGGDVVTEPGVVDFDTVASDVEGRHLESRRVFRRDDVASLFHTGGTTGTPKLARHLHANEVFMSWASAMQSNVRSDDVRVCGVPLFHVTGALTNCLMPLSVGASIVMLTSGGWRHPSVVRNIWAIVERFGVTALSLVPSVVNVLLNVPIGKHDISSLQTVSSGTAPLSVNVSHAFSEMTGAVVIEGYGLTEATAISAVNPRYGPTKVGSVGIRMAYVQIKAVVVDAKGRWQRDCRPMEAGVIVIRGPSVFPGYLDERQNESLWVADGWLNTGDVGYLDDDGYCFLTGRAKDLIIRGGNNLDPRLIEEAFYAHPAVLDVAAVGMPDAHAGELPVVYLSARPGCTLNLQRLKFYAYEAIPERAAVPKAFYLVDRLPKTAVGKMQKNVLRADAVRRAQEEALGSVRDARSVEIEVADRPEGGFTSTIRLLISAKADEAAVTVEVERALLRFTVPYSLSVYRAAS
jgi:fatty-acyl-CoA synthase